MGPIYQKSEFHIGNTRVEAILQPGFSERGVRRLGDMHCHPNFEVHYIESGIFCFEHEKGTERLEKDTIVLIPPRIYHSFNGEGESLRRISFELKLSMLKYGTDVFGDYDALFSSVDSPTFIRRFTPELIQLGDCMGIVNGDEEICKLNARLALAFIEICKLLRRGSAGEAERAHKQNVQIASTDEDLTLIKILEYVRLNHRSRISLSDVANFVSLSERQVQRVLASRMGESFRAILADNRITDARSMILSADHADRSLEQIACECGYSNYVSFWMQFKKATGKTPEQFRADLKKG